MTRDYLDEFILTTYNATSDHPWPRYPDYTVYRHPANKKWFALLMEVSPSVFTTFSPPALQHAHKRKTRTAEKTVCVLNVKCDPILAGSFRSEPGIHPAYHMNKDKWISVELAIVPEKTILLLLEMSFNATAPKAKKLKAEDHKPRKTYPERFFRDLGIKDLSSDAELADTLISFLITEPITRSYKDDYEILIEYYKEQKTLNEIAHERGITTTCISQKRNRGLRRIRGRYDRAYEPKSLDEYYEGVKKRSAQERRGIIIAPGQPLTLDSSIQELDITSPRVFNGLWRDGIRTVGQLLSLTGEEKIQNMGERSWERIRAAQAEARERLSPHSRDERTLTAGQKQGE